MKKVIDGIKSGIGIIKNELAFERTMGKINNLSFDEKVLVYKMADNAISDMPWTPEDASEEIKNIGEKIQKMYYAPQSSGELDNIKAIYEFLTENIKEDMINKIKKMPLKEKEELLNLLEKKRNIKHHIKNPTDYARKTIPELPKLEKEEVVEISKKVNEIYDDMYSAQAINGLVTNTKNFIHQSILDTTKTKKEQKEMQNIKNEKDEASWKQKLEAENLVGKL